MSDLLEAAKAVIQDVGNADVLFEPVYLSEEQWESENARLELARSALEGLAAAVEVAETSDEEKFRALLKEAVYSWPQCDTDDEINGGDAVEWLGDFRRRVMAALGITGPATVICKFCHEPASAVTAHLHDGEWVGDECCWTEQLRGSE